MKPALLIVIAVLAAAGCGDSDDPTTATGAASSSSTVDDAAVEAGIKEDLSTPTSPVSSAKCPDDVKSEKGNTFTCTVTFESGVTGKVTVTQGAANQFTYQLKEGSVQVPGEVAETSVKKQLAAEGAPNAQVNCPDNIIVKVGTTVTCAVSDASGKANGEVTWTFSSAEGEVDPDSVETP